MVRFRSVSWFSPILSNSMSWSEGWFGSVSWAGSGSMSRGWSLSEFRSWSGSMSGSVSWSGDV